MRVLCALLVVSVCAGCAGTEDRVVTDRYGINGRDARSKGGDRHGVGWTDVVRSRPDWQKEVRYG
jgi:hypothetical protein